jgi:chlorobactene glucosyltransferase
MNHPFSLECEILFLALFIPIALSCLYLHYLFTRSFKLIPNIVSHQRGHKQVKKLNTKKGKDNNNYSGSGYKNALDIKDNNGYLAAAENKTSIVSIDTDHKSISTNDLPFVSIVVPARNEEEYIERCLISLLSQDYPHFEVIAIDDNSTDSTLKIMEDMKNNKKDNLTDTQVEKLKVLSIKDKPEKWAGKTWASQQGFIESTGSILLFTDADTNHARKDVILCAVCYMQKENLDVLTGIPTSEKPSKFWSRITVPSWNLVSPLFGIHTGDVNNPKSSIAYLMGSFFLIKRDVFAKVGAFEQVYNAIQEDKALGVIIKRKGYRIRLVRLREMVYTLWADDLVTLWHGIGRTLAPLVMRNRPKILIRLLVIALSCILPFVLLPFTISSASAKLPFVSPYEIPLCYEFYALILNVACCFIVLSESTVRCKASKISPMYSLGAPIGSVFVVVASLYNVIPLLIFGSTRPIVWQGRQYTYNKEQEGFTI